jgi:glycosyltransferase involved in cell wall biosynthesis
MRILQLVTARQYRGAEVFAALLSEELAGMGEEVYYVGLYDPPAQELTVAGCTNADLGGTKQRGFSPSLFRRLRTYYLTHRPDVIQANGSDTLKYTVALKLLHPELRFVYRNISVFSVWVASEWRRRIQEWMFRRVDFVTSVSAESRKDLIKTLNYPADRIRVVRRGVKADRQIPAAEAREQLGVAGPVVALVGKLSPEKNHAFLLRTFARLLEAVPDARLWFIGDGPERSRIEASVTQLGLGNSVTLWGVQTDVAPFLAAADVLAITSTVEGIPGVILEGAVQSTPTVSVDVGGVKEVLLDQHTGLLIDRHDERIFAAALERVLTDDPLRQRLGEAARRRVVEEYSLDRAARESLAIYRQIRATP